MTSLVLSIISNGQTKKPATDYLSVPGPIVFLDKSYVLNWSSHPTNNLYKQEYIVKGDLEDKYGTMILLDLIPSEPDIKKVVAAKIAEIKKIKEGNPVVNFESFDNPKTGEYMIDFLLTANSPDGKSIDIVERNVYRYKAFTDKSGRKGVLLFGVSTRSYGNDIDKFFATLKTNRKDLINEVSKFKIPDIAISK
jgi:hypothetical protein